MSRSINFNDTIDNGILFSQLCASMLRESKGLIKEVEFVDHFNRKHSSLVLMSTETNIKSVAQVCCAVVIAEYIAIYRSYLRTP